jgi:hypothetical protein
MVLTIELFEWNFGDFVNVVLNSMHVICFCTLKGLMGLFSDGSDSPFSYFWVTDSCPVTIKEIENRAPFEVISLAGSIADALQI